MKISAHRAKRSEVQYGPLHLVLWVNGAGTWAEIGKIALTHFDKMRLAWHAAHNFSHAAEQVDGYGVLVKLQVLGDLFRMAGLADLASHLPEVPQTLPIPPVRLRPSLQDLRADQIRSMHRLMCEGHSQAYAARMAGLTETTASLLRRGLLPSDRLAPDAQAAFRDTFARSIDLQGKRVKRASIALDQRNAQHVIALHALLHRKDTSLANAAKTIGISAPRASKLRRRPGDLTGPQTTAAWFRSFGKTATD